jgi:multisubunit Na+/H+ antiporter MnhF subunit
MNGWLIAFIALAPACAIPLIAASRGSITSRLVAVQLLTSLTTLALVAITFVVDQPTFIDLALALALLALPGTLLMALFIERWI